MEVSRVFGGVFVQSKELNKDSNLRVLKEIAELLNEGTEISPLLKKVLQKLLEGTGVTTGWIFFIDHDGRHTVVSTENLPEALEKNNCKIGRAPCRERV